MSKRQKALKALKAAFPHTIPILTRFAFLGITYGVCMWLSGFSFLYSMLMSLLVFGGSLEMAAVQVLLSPFDPLQVLLVSILIYARHLFCGIAMQ